MSEVPFEWPGWPAKMLFRHLDKTVAPPPGYTSWAEFESVSMGGLIPMTRFISPGAVPRGRKVSIVWTRTSEDVATCGLHIVHRDGETELVDMTDDDCGNVEDHLDTFWNSIKGDYTSDIQLDEYAWHDFGVGVRRPNPRNRDTIKSPAVAGTSDADRLPQQVAISLTFKTLVRRNWGRIYLPAPVTAALDGGRFSDSFISSIRTAFGTFMDALIADHLALVVWCPRRGGGPLKFGKETIDGMVVDHHALMDDDPDSTSFALTADTVQVDDIPDVIRRRRVDTALFRETHTPA